MNVAGVRIWALSCVLTLLLAALCFTRWGWIQDQYKTLTLRPLPARCDSPPPAWLASIGVWAARHEFPGLQVHLRANGITYDCSFGDRINADGSRSPMEITTKLPYASVTKVFASALAVTQMQRDLLNENEQIYDRLGLAELRLNGTDRWQKITLGMLLRHQGGFDRLRSGDPMLRPDPPCPKQLDRLRDVPIDFEPGTRYAYSNLGYCLVGLAMERATSRTLPNLYRTELFEPHGLSILSIRSSDDLFRHDIGLDPRSEEQASLAAWPWHALDAVGNLAGTARDIGTFLHRIESSPVGKALLQPLTDCDDRFWRRCHGLAFYSYRKGGRPRMFWRDGSIPGVTAFAAITEHGDVFVLLGNARDPERWISIHDELGQLVYDHFGSS